MQALRSLALFSFLAGLVLLVVGFVSDLKDGPVAADTSSTPVTFEITAPPTPTPRATPTPLPPDAPTPTPAPPPFDGAVARMKIPRFGVDSAIENIGLLANNTLDTPHNPHNTGWYTIYDKPGFGGNAVFSAHVDYFPNILGPFHKLSKTDLGDEIIVTMANGLEYHYKIIRKARYNVDSIPMGDLIWPQNKPAEVEWVTLITCGGEFRATSSSGAGEYLQRDVVVAERIKS